jgi:hypothetical protein
MCLAIAAWHGLFGNRRVFKLTHTGQAPCPTQTPPLYLFSSAD